MCQIQSHQNLLRKCNTLTRFDNLTRQLQNYT